MNLKQDEKLKKELCILYRLYKFSVFELLQYKALNYSEIDLSVDQIKEAIKEEIDPKYFLFVGEKFDSLYSLSNRYFINLESKNLGNDFIDKVKRYQISHLENIHIYIDKYFRKVFMDPNTHKFLKNEPIIIKHMYIKKKNNNYILEFESNGLDALSKQITGNKGGKNNNVIDSLLFSEIELQNIVNKNVSKGITINKVIKDLNLSLKHVKVEVPYIYFGQDISQTSFQFKLSQTSQKKTIYKGKNIEGKYGYKRDEMTQRILKLKNTYTFDPNMFRNSYGEEKAQFDLTRYENDILDFLVTSVVDYPFPNTPKKRNDEKSINKVYNDLSNNEFLKYTNNQVEKISSLPNNELKKNLTNDDTYKYIEELTNRNQPKLQAQLSKFFNKVDEVNYYEANLLYSRLAQKIDEVLVDYDIEKTNYDIEYKAFNEASHTYSIEYLDFVSEYYKYIQKAFFSANDENNEDIANRPSKMSFIETYERVKFLDNIKKTKIVSKNNKEEYPLYKYHAIDKYAKAEATINDIMVKNILNIPKSIYRKKDDEITKMIKDKKHSKTEIEEKPIENDKSLKYDEDTKVKGNSNDYNQLKSREYYENLLYSERLKYELKTAGEMKNIKEKINLLYRETIKSIEDLAFYILSEYLSISEYNESKFLTNTSLAENNNISELKDIYFKANPLYQFSEEHKVERDSEFIPLLSLLDKVIKQLNSYFDKYKENYDIHHKLMDENVANQLINANSYKGNNLLVEQAIEAITSMKLREDLYKYHIKTQNQIQE
ncbi:hypothetical protein MXF31_11535 [Mammaliicoccus sciuri]|uniref:hypothetical protein n=1 Tax=Mammaliicoccus sciuri TaxID=1296 RepID=UPI002DB7CDD9|nr:hypothetical protein [Mammaliicoccus sciuri]MEB5650274.1 hypothetical protein [Mammaliicoccus sciuri]